MGFKLLIGTRVLLVHMMAVVEEFQKNWNSSMRTAESTLGRAAGGRWHRVRQLPTKERAMDISTCVVPTKEVVYGDMQEASTRFGYGLSPCFKLS